MNFYSQHLLDFSECLVDLGIESGALFVILLEQFFVVLKKNLARKIVSQHKKSPKIFGTFRITSYLCTVRTSVLTIR